MTNRSDRPPDYRREVMEVSDGDGRRDAPAFARNCPPIVEILSRHLPDSGRVLELASGTGQHVVEFARSHPGVAFQPSDSHSVSRKSIGAWRSHAGLGNILEPLDLDVTRRAWWDGLEPGYTAMIAINLWHIAPWAAMPGTLQGAQALLSDTGFLFVYGPFMHNGEHNSPGNEQFDLSLKQSNFDWGLRDIAEVETLARQFGLTLAETVAMPANNVSLILRRVA
jgi:hypothetical protein